MTLALECGLQFPSVSTLLELVYNFKHLERKQFHNIVKGDSTLFKKFKETAKYSFAKWDK